MSIFNELLPKIIEISNAYTNKFDDDLKAAFECIDKFEEEFLHGRALVRGKAQKIPHLQSINEDEDETPKNGEKTSSSSKSDKSSIESTGQRASKKRSKHEVEDMESPEQEKRQKRNASVKAQSIISKQVNVNLSQKLRREISSDKSKRRRGKEDKENTVPMPVMQIKQEKISLCPVPMEINGISDNKDEIAMPPPMAPVPKPRKALQKARSEDSTDDESSSKKRTTRSKKDTDGQNAQTDKPVQNVAEDPEESSTTKRTTRAKKEPVSSQTVVVQASRKMTRSSSRATKQLEEEVAILETRPKRTRAKKVAETEKENPAPVENGTGSPAEKPRPKRTRRRKSEKQPEKPVNTTQSESEPEVALLKDERIQKEIQSPILHSNSIKYTSEKLISHKLIETTCVEKTATKIYKNVNNNETGKTGDKVKNLTNGTGIEQNIDGDKNIEIQRKQEINNTNETERHEKEIKDADKAHKYHKEIKDVEKADRGHKEIKDADKAQRHLNEIKDVEKAVKDGDKGNSNSKGKAVDNVNSNKVKPNTDVVDNIELDVTRVIGELNVTVTISSDLDKSPILPNGVYHNDPQLTKVMYAMNETVVLEHNRETVVLDRPQINGIMNATVVLDRAEVGATNLTEDNSLLTDDSDVIAVTPPRKPPAAQPTSAVKEKVQQFEEMASRATRTKTRAMAKKEEQPEEETPPDKPSKSVLSSETLAKMNSMIFNGKHTQLSSSTSKPRPAVTGPTKSLIPAPGPKLSGVKAREADEQRKEREDARKKKEAILEAKREMQKKKREDKMAAAAAAREAAERERRAALEAAARERLDKQAHADQSKLERLREVERKKQELARKAVETEERRKAEEQARQQRLVDDQKKAELARKKQLEEAELLKKETVMVQKDMEKKQKEFIERQRMKQRMENDKLCHKNGSPYPPMPPAYMLDGFQYLNSDESDEDEPRVRVPVPAWSGSKARHLQLVVQAHVSSGHVDKLFSVRAQTPDLREIFPNIERARLKRTSSAVWRTPPARLPALAE